MPAPGESAARRPGVHAALLSCEVCGTETLHRILRLERARPDDPRERLSGLARCGVCRLVHRFVSEGPADVEVRTVVSEGGRSTAGRMRLPQGLAVEVGARLAVPGPPLTVRKVERRDRAAVPAAAAPEIATLWLTPDVGSRLAVSIVEGRRTRTVKLVLPPSTPLAVAGEIEVEGRALWIAGLRARGQTWRRPGDRFPAEEVQRVYARRTAIPPEGRSDWRSDRETPSSRASPISRSARSRSSAGVRTTRTRAGSRQAERGATIHFSSP